MTEVVMRLMRMKWLRSFLNIVLFYNKFVAKTTDGFDFYLAVELFELFAEVGHIDFDVVVFGEHIGTPDVGENVVFLDGFIAGVDEHFEDFRFLFGERLAVERAVGVVKFEVGEFDGFGFAESGTTGERVRWS